MRGMREKAGKKVDRKGCQHKSNDSRHLCVTVFDLVFSVR